MDGSVDRKKPATHGRNSVPWILLAALLVGVGFVLALGQTYDIVATAALVWGLALYVTGVLVGFLFGIPKVPDRAASTPPKTTDGESATDSESSVKKATEADTRRLSGINSNLVEVSDWLTKIIVGVGLVELKQLPTYGQSLAGFIAGSLVKGPAGAMKAADLTSIAGAIALFFAVLGFITGYLMTRIFLAIIMNDADRNAEEVSLWRLSGGAVVDTPTILSGLKSAIDDVQAKVAGLISGKSAGPSQPDSVPPQDATNIQPPAGETKTPDAGAPPADEAKGAGQEGAPSPAGASTELEAANTGTPPLAEPVANEKPPSAPRDSSVAARALAPSVGKIAAYISKKLEPKLGHTPVRRLLWVDDIPNNNTLVVDRLRRAGVVVQQVMNTSTAMQHLEREAYDIVITDMSRPEGGNRSEAGLRLIDAVAQFAARMPPNWRKPLTFVYCGKASLARYGDLAVGRGADFATASEVELLSILGQIYPELLT